MIEIKNQKYQSVVLTNSKPQAIKVDNRVKQSIPITNKKFQNIGVKNAIKKEISVKQSVVINSYDAPNYDGDYQVTPKLEPQTLATAQKMMLQDVEIKEIPIIKVSNQSGGKTVIIG